MLFSNLLSDAGKLSPSLKSDAKFHTRTPHQANLIIRHFGLWHYVASEVYDDVSGEINFSILRVKAMWLHQQERK